MPNWLSISFGIFCALTTIGQLRMTLIYLGVLQSPTVGPFEGPQTTLMHTAIRSAISCGIFSLIFFLVTWPKSLLFNMAILTFRAVIDLILLRKGVDMFHLYAPDGSFAQARSSMLSSKIWNIFFFVVGFAAVFYFFRDRTMSDSYMGLIFVIAVGICLSLVVYAFTKRVKVPAQLDSQQERPVAYATPNQNQRHLADLRQNLRLKFMYDEAKIDRAIDLERKRFPDASLDDLMQAAIERWERNNR